MIKVVYDISVLGMALLDNRARTGVYRVVENVAIGVVQSSTVELRFCSSIGNEKECQDYLKGHQFLQSHHKSFSSPLTSVLDNVIYGSNSWRRFTRKFTGSKASPVVYHSPYHPIPQTIRNRTDVAKVLTVYDLIAILYPNYMIDGGDSHYREVLDSVTPDTNVICISESTKQDLCNLSSKIDSQRVFVTHLAASAMFYPCLDPDAIARVRQKYGIGAVHYILSVSTLEPRKNIEIVIRSFIRLVLEQRLNDLCLVLTGATGWKHENIFSEIEHALEFKDRIILTGYVADEDLSPLYSGAMAFVYPSFYEGFGLPPLEAMQCGTPVITSNTSSLPEVVGNAGIMVEPNDGDALCQAMYDLYRNGGLRNQLAQKSLARAEQFSWERCATETIEVYRQAANS